MLNNEEIHNFSYDQFGEILNVLTQGAPKKEDLEKAQDLIKSYSKNKESISMLLKHIEMNQKNSNKQLAALLLSKKIIKHWNGTYNKNNNTSCNNIVTKDEKTKILESLITLISKEKNYIVCKTIALTLSKLLISNINNIISENNNTIDYETEILLNNYIFKDPSVYNSSESHIFEVNLFIISEVLEECNSESLVPYLASIKNIVTIAINNGNNKMKENATRSLGNMIKSFEIIQISDLKQLIPKIFDSIEKFSEESISHIFETICDFSIKSLQFFEDSFETIVKIAYKLLDNEVIQISTKMILVEVVQMISECKKKVFTNNKSNLLTQGIELAFKFTTDIDEFNQYLNNASDEVLENDISLFEIGNRLLGVLSLNIKSSTFYPLIIDYISKFVNNFNTNICPNKKRAAIYAIGVICSGCIEKYISNLSEIVNVLVNAFTSEENILIKKAAIVSIDYLIESLEDHMGDFHNLILPMLYNGLTINKSTYISNNNHNVNIYDSIVCSCLVELNYFVRTLDFEIEDYIEKFLPVLVNIILNHSSLNIKSEALFALSSFISQGDEELIKNIDYIKLIETCENIIFYNNNSSNKNLNSQYNDLKGYALRCIGELAAKLLRKNVDLTNDNNFLTNLLPKYNDVAVKYISNNINEYSLIESGFSYLGLISSVVNLDNDLHNLMEIAMKIISDQSGIFNKNKDGDEFNFDSDSEIEEGNQVNKKNMTVNTDFVNAKCAAILAVSLFFESQASRISLLKTEINLDNTFIKYLEILINTYEMLWDNIDDNVNYELINSYKSLTASVFKVNNTLGRALWINTVFFKFEEFLKETDDTLLASNIYEAIYIIISTLKKEAFLNREGTSVTNIIERLLDLTVVTLSKKLPCQLYNTNDEDDDFEDYEEKLINSASDIYLILAEVYEDGFHTYFSELTDNINKYFGKKRSEFEKALAFAIYAEVFKYCKTSVKFYSSYIFKQIEFCLQDNNVEGNSSELYRNIAFLIGVMYQSDSENIKEVKNIQETFQLINNIYTKGDITAKDNAIAALCKIITSLKIDIFSDIFKSIFIIIIDKLPLVNDASENDAVLLLWNYLLNQYMSKEIDSNNSDTNNVLIDIENNIHSLVNTLKYCVNHIKKCDIQNSTYTLLKSTLNLSPNNIKNAFTNLLNKLCNSERDKLLNKLN